jgi:tetrahydromethanopterin S-methyltransferase subunit G
MTSREQRHGALFGILFGLIIGLILLAKNGVF